jgi:hypothetical protein
MRVWTLGTWFFQKGVLKGKKGEQALRRGVQLVTMAIVLPCSKKPKIV